MQYMGYFVIIQRKHLEITYLKISLCATLFCGNLSAVKYIYLFINCISEEEIVAQVSATTVLIHLYLTLVVCDNCIILSQKM